MSLAKEERDLFTGCKFSSNPNVVRLIHIIDRLVAENEGLEKSRNVWANRHLNPKVEQLQSKLTALIEAAELVEGERITGISCDDIAPSYHELPDEFESALNKLAEAIKEAKG